MRKCEKVCKGDAWWVAGGGDDGDDHGNGER